MKILMMTNTYKPIVGGLERSVEAFTREYRRRGHRTIVMAPSFPGMPDAEADVIRLPAIQHFNNTEFSVKLPLPGIVAESLEGFVPEIVHAHHPFLLGASALRLAYVHKTPIVFTHHTLFEQYTHYVPGGETDAMKRFVAELSTSFGNLVDTVFAPSESVAGLLKSRGVETRIEIVPTGIDVERFASGDGAAFRKRRGIPDDAFVVGHVGRLAPEKNLEFLAKALAGFALEMPGAHVLVVGKGPSEAVLTDAFAAAGAEKRLHMAGVAEGNDLVDAYHAMDVFAFASQSETQGLVVTEALASGVPVVAVDASGVREVVEDGVNGRLLPKEDAADFVRALKDAAAMTKPERAAWAEAARRTATRFSTDVCVSKALSVYESLRAHAFAARDIDDSAWTRTMRRVKAEWDLMKALTKATTGAVIKENEELGINKTGNVG